MYPKHIFISILQLYRTWFVSSTRITSNRNKPLLFIYGPYETTQNMPQNCLARFSLFAPTPASCSLNGLFFSHQISLFWSPCVSTTLINFPMTKLYAQICNLCLCYTDSVHQGFFHCWNSFHRLSSGFSSIK